MTLVLEQTPGPESESFQWQAHMPALPHSIAVGEVPVPALTTSGPLPGTMFCIPNPDLAWLSLQAWGQTCASYWSTLGAGCHDPISWPVPWMALPRSEEDWPDLLEEPALPSMTSCPRAPQRLSQWAGQSGLMGRECREARWRVLRKLD